MGKSMLFTLMQDKDYIAALILAGLSLVIAFLVAIPYYFWYLKYGFPPADTVVLLAWTAVISYMLGWKPTGGGQ